MIDRGEDKITITFHAPVGRETLRFPRRRLLRPVALRCGDAYPAFGSGQPVPVTTSRQGCNCTAVGLAAIPGVANLGPEASDRREGPRRVLECLAPSLADRRIALGLVESESDIGGPQDQDGCVETSHGKSVPSVLGKTTG